MQNIGKKRAFQHVLFCREQKDEIERLKQKFKENPNAALSESHEAVLSIQNKIVARQLGLEVHT